MPPSPAHRTVRVAVVQTAPVAFDRVATLERVAARTRDAAERGAKLVLFPEAFVSAYPRGLSFGTVIGSRTAEGREWYRRYWESSVAVPGPDADALAAIARTHGVHLVVGVIERDGGTLYCSVLFFAPDGALLGTHRKLMPTAAERLVWGQGDGSTMQAHRTDIGIMGAAICWENYMPMYRMSLYGQQVQLYLAPTADSRDSWIATVRHIAMEGRCFVLSCNQFARRSDYPDDYPLDTPTTPDTILTRGGSCIVHPLGDVIAGPVYDEDALLVADLDLGDTIRGKYDFDVTGHYARPDIFDLRVDTRARRAVSEFNSTDGDLHKHDATPSFGTD
jgi:nitrilase